MQVYLPKEEKELQQRDKDKKWLKNCKWGNYIEEQENLQATQSNLLAPQRKVQISKTKKKKQAEKRTSWTWLQHKDKMEKLKITSINLA